MLDFDFNSWNVSMSFVSLGWKRNYIWERRQISLLLSSKSIFITAEIIRKPYIIPLQLD